MTEPNTTTRAEDQGSPLGTQALPSARRAEIEEYLALGHDNWEWRDLPFEVEASWATTRELLDALDAVTRERDAATEVVWSVIQNWPYDLAPNSPYWNLVSIVAADDAAATPPVPSGAGGAP